MHDWHHQGWRDAEMVSERVAAEDPHRQVALGQWLVRERLQRTHIDEWHWVSG